MLSRGGARSGRDLNCQSAAARWIKIAAAIESFIAIKSNAAICTLWCHLQCGRIQSLKQYRSDQVAMDAHIRVLAFDAKFGECENDVCRGESRPASTSPTVLSVNLHPNCVLAYFSSFDKPEKVRLACHNVSRWGSGATAFLGRHSAGISEHSVIVRQRH